MKTRGTILLLIAAVVWGLAFSVQSVGVKTAGSYTFNCFRMLLGAVFLLPFIKIFDEKGLSPNRPKNSAERKKLWKQSLLCGLFLFVATNLQQLALALGAGPGRGGFLTTIYILIVPIAGMVIYKKKCGWNIWAGVVLALFGLYLLCISGEFALNTADLLLILCAFSFAGHIITVDRAVEQDALRLSAIQFFICGILTALPMIIFDILPEGFSAWSGVFSSGTFWITVLYMGIMSCGVGYTLQIIGQRDLNPTVASLIMSGESVFSVLFGWLLLKEALTFRQLMGCLLILAAVVIAQINFSKKKMKEVGQK